jgi:hypothetical protein
MPCRTVGETQMGLSSARKIIPRMRSSPRPQISRAFVPPCIQKRSERSRAAPSWTASLGPATRGERAGTLDAHCVHDRASRMPAPLPERRYAASPGKCSPAPLRGPMGPPVERGCLQRFAPAGRVECRACAVVGQGHWVARLFQASLRRESFCSSSVSVFMPEVARMRSSICVLSSRNARVCFMSCTRRAGSGTS